MEDVSYMVCRRVEDLAEPVEGSTTTACVECGLDIWISSASRKELSRLGAMPVCAQCADRLAKEVGQEIEIGTPSDEQFEEVVRTLRAQAESEDRPEWLRALDGDEVDLFESMKSTAQMAGAAMSNPDDDWGQIVVMETYDGLIMPPVPLSDILRSGIPKDVIARQLLPGMALAGGIKRVCFGLSTWALTSDQPFDPESLAASIQHHPDSKEMLVLIDLTADGVQKMAMAEITRDGVSKPVLGEWIDADQPAASDGLFIDALLPVLQLIRQQRGNE